MKQSKKTNFPKRGSSGSTEGHGNPPASEQRKSRERDANEATPGKQIDGQEVAMVPNDYRRNDLEILNDVATQLSQKLQTAHELIAVQVTDGEVTLQGTVSQQEARTVAENVAQSVLGTQRVNNRLLVAGI